MTEKSSSRAKTGVPVYVPITPDIAAVLRAFARQQSALLFLVGKWRSSDRLQTMAPVPHSAVRNRQHPQGRRNSKALPFTCSVTLLQLNCSTKASRSTGCRCCSGISSVKASEKHYTHH